MKHAIYPLYAPADEGRVRPILDALKAKGVTVRTGAPGREDALLLFLSQNVQAEGPEADAFFRLSPGRALVIPVNLDGSAPPEELQNALLARHGLDGAKYSAPELAERIARSVQGGGGGRLPLILSLVAAAALLLVGGLIWWRQKPPEEPAAPVVEATVEPTPTPTLAPTPVPTPEPVFPEEVDLTLQELEKVFELIIVGDSFNAYIGEEEWVAANDLARVGAEHVAIRSLEDGRAHWYSTEDGHEFALHDWGDLSFLSYMKNLELLTLVDVRGTLPDLSGLKKLSCLELFDCAIDDISAAGKNRLRAFNYSGAPIDLSPLNGGTALDSMNVELYGANVIDLGSFGPTSLRILNLSGDGAARSADLTGLKNCRKLERVWLNGLPLSDLTCFSGTTVMGILELIGMDQLTSLSGLENRPLLNSVSLNNCTQLRDLSALSTCVGLQELRIRDCPVQDLSFLEGVKALKRLNMEQISTLRSFRGLEGHGSLQGVDAHNLPNLTDISALSSCSDLRSLTLSGCFALQDVTVVTELSRLRDLQLYGAGPNNVDYLWDIQDKEYFSFGVSEVDDWTGLGAIQRYSYLSITDRSGRALPYIENATVTDFELWNRYSLGNQSYGLDITRLPHVTNRMELHCVTSLEGLDQPDVRRVILDDCPYLTTLSGMEGMTRLVQLEVYNCPRLTDWSAIDGRELDEIILEALFTLPDFGNLSAKEVSLTTIYDLKDLSCFENFRQDGYRIKLMDVDGVTDLSPLYHLHGAYLEIPAHLREQALVMYESGLLDHCSVAYPFGGWEPIQPHIELLSLSEIDTLPSALLARVERLTLAGDMVVPNEGAWVEEDWSEDPPALYLRYQESEERYPVTPGTLTDLTVLEKLTGLQALTIYAQPELASLEGIQAMSGLNDLDLRQCPALADASAAFTVQSLEKLRFWFTGVRSIQGIQNLYALKMLDLNDNPVDDLSPLAACPALEDVHFELPMMTFEELMALPEGVRRNIRNLSIAGEYVYADGPWWFETDWVTDPPQLYLHSNETDERLPLLTGAVMDMSEVAALLPNLEGLDLYGQDLTTLDGVEAFPQLWEINISECRKITDFSALWRSPSLGDISLRNEPIESIEGIEQMPRLVSINLSGTGVKDFSPLTRVDYSYCTSEEYFGWAFMLALDVADGDKLTYEDYAPLEAVPVYWGLNMNNVPVGLWLDHIMGKEMHELSCHRSDMTNEQLRAFVKAHPMLEQLDLRWNPQLTDLSCLLTLSELRNLYLSSDMPEAKASLGEGYPFRLEID